MDSLDVFAIMGLFGATFSIAAVIGLISAMRKPGTVAHIDTSAVTPEEQRQIEELEHLYQL